MWKTSVTMLRDICSEDPVIRAERIETLVRIYRPVWEVAAKGALRRYGGDQVDIRVLAEDVVSEQVRQMIESGSGYFATYDPARGRLGRWVAKRCWNRSIDALKKTKFCSLPGNIIDPSLDQEVDIETTEMFELMKEAFRIAESLAERDGFSTEFRIFRAVRISSDRIPVAERRVLGWTEYEEKKALAHIWSLIRDTAIPLAADTISSRPEDATELAQKLWDFMKFRGTFPAPGQKTVT